MAPLPTRVPPGPLASLPPPRPPHPPSFSLHSLAPGIASGLFSAGQAPCNGGCSLCSAGPSKLLSLPPPLPPLPLPHLSALPADPARGAPSNPAPGHEPPGVQGHECTQSRHTEDLHSHLHAHAHLHLVPASRASAPPPAHSRLARAASGQPCSVIGGSQSFPKVRATAGAEPLSTLRVSAARPGPACAWAHAGADTRGYPRTGQTFPDGSTGLWVSPPFLVVAESFGTTVAKRLWTCQFQQQCWDRHAYVGGRLWVTAGG